MKPMKHYYVHAPGWVYALSFYGRNERGQIVAVTRLVAA